MAPAMTRPADFGADDKEEGGGTGGEGIVAASRVDSSPRGSLMAQLGAKGAKELL